MIASRWVEAFNARDIEGMLACLAEDVKFHPLRLGGCSGSYSGHDGIRLWWDQLNSDRLDHVIVISETRDVGADRIIASGSLNLADQSEIGSFCALHTLDGDLIVKLHHYLSDADMIEHLGLIR